MDHSDERVTFAGETGTEGGTAEGVGCANEEDGAAEKVTDMRRAAGTQFRRCA